MSWWFWVELFAALPESASTIKVGAGASQADYRASRPEEVMELLVKLTQRTR